MKKSKMKIVASLALSVMLVSCGSTTGSSTSSNGSTVGNAIIGALAEEALGSNTTKSAINSAVNAGTVISGLIGQLTNSSTSASSIVGKWSYVEPTIQFESENLLAKAGGALASNAIINKIEPYYKKVGITAGTLSYVFNKDNTCKYTIKGKTFEGTYVYNAKANTLTITNSLGMNVMNAYVTVSSKNMAVTFDSSKLLSFIQKSSSVSTNSTISTLSSISKSYSGMKTGFLLKKQ